MQRRDFLIASASTILTSPTAQVRPATSGERVDALLQAVGGRAAWARAKGYRVDATHLLAGLRLPFRNTIHLDFEAPRLRVESDQEGLWRARIVQSASGLRMTAAEQRALTPTEVADELSFWRSNIYRTLHRLARRDQTLAVAVDDDRLMISESGAALLWILQNAAGEPIAFGPGTDEPGTIFGPLVQASSLKFPSFSVRDGGRWRAIIRRFVVDPDLSDAALVSRSSLLLGL